MVSSLENPLHEWLGWLDFLYAIKVFKNLFFYILTFSFILQITCWRILPFREFFIVANSLANCACAFSLARVTNPSIELIHLTLKLLNKNCVTASNLSLMHLMQYFLLHLFMQHLARKLFCELTGLLYYCAHRWH